MLSSLEIRKSKIYASFLVVVLLSCGHDKTPPPDYTIVNTINDVVNYSDNKAKITAYNLINPQTAHNLLTAQPDNYIPIQISKKAPFAKEHITNSINLWRPDYGSDSPSPYGGLRASPDKIEHLLQELGYEKGNTLLLYDVKANVDALRFAWVLNLYGFDDFKIINGGLAYWKKLNLPTTKDSTVAPTRSNYRLENKLYFDKTSFADFSDVMSAITDTNTLLIDTRENDEYMGQPFTHKQTVIPFKNGAFARGSIPSAIHLNWSVLADLSDDHRIKSEKNLRHDLAHKGITTDKKIILYCHSGSRTSHTYYVLKHVLGYCNVKNYDGSWIEWSYKSTIDRSVPIQQLCTEQEFKTIRDSLVNDLKTQK